MDHAAHSYNAEASTMGSDASVSFGGGVIDGLNYGAVSANITAPGTPTVIDTIQMNLTLIGQDHAGEGRPREPGTLHSG